MLINKNFHNTTIFITENFILLLSFIQRFLNATLFSAKPFILFLLTKLFYDDVISFIETFLKITNLANKPFFHNITMFIEKSCNHLYQPNLSQCCIFITLILAILSKPSYNATIFINQDLHNATFLSTKQYYLFSKKPFVMLHFHQSSLS